MSIYKLVAETCAGGEIRDALTTMVDIAQRHHVIVECNINGVTMTVGWDRVDDLHALWLLRMQLTEPRATQPAATDTAGGSDGEQG